MQYLPFYNILGFWYPQNGVSRSVCHRSERHSTHAFKWEHIECLKMSGVPPLYLTIWSKLTATSQVLTLLKWREIRAFPVGFSVHEVMLVLGTQNCGTLGCSTWSQGNYKNIGSFHSFLCILHNALKNCSKWKRVKVALLYKYLTNWFLQWKVYKYMDIKLVTEGVTS